LFLPTFFTGVSRRTSDRSIMWLGLHTMVGEQWRANNAKNFGILTSQDRKNLHGRKE